jgi:hypothetical protein
LAPNGILGLGTREISMPNTLNRKLGLLDSFSVYTNFNGIGKIMFGNNGRINQKTIPFISNSK